MTDWPPKGIEWYWSDDSCAIACGDCLELLPKLPEGCVDLVLTDPPYGIGMKAFRDSLTVACNGMNLTPGTKAITFMSPRMAVDFVSRLYSWDFRRFLWWNKSADLSFPWRGWYMNSEIICVFDRKNAQWPKNCRFRSDLYQSGPVGKKPPHPAWKPIDVLGDLIQHAYTEGPVLDPFMGSGPVLMAAKDLGHRAIGIEIEEKYCRIAVERLQQDVLPLQGSKPEKPRATQGSLI